jgi:transient receptor potential cation channel subfamily A protein 1
MMVKFGRTNHLSHPLCETLLRQKWLSYGFPIYMLNLFFYLLFIFAFSYFIITFSACNHRDSASSTSPTHSCPNANFISFQNSATVSQILSIWFIILYCLVNCLFQIVRLFQDSWDYFSDIENYIQWIIYVSASLFAVPFLFNESWHYQWVVGSIGIFAAYLGLLFLLGRFDVYGIYVIMFLEILKTLLHVLSLFSILIVGFALTFCIVRPFTQVIKFEARKCNRSFIYSESSSIRSPSFVDDYTEISDNDVR